MITKQNITLAYELALKNYKNKSFTFMQIWKDLVKKCKFDEEEQKNISQFYVDLLQDKRFIFVGNKKWKIREFLKHDEIVKLENALYDFEQEDEENGDTYSKSETKKTNDNTTTINKRPIWSWINSIFKLNTSPNFESSPAIDINKLTKFEQNNTLKNILDLSALSRACY